MPTPAGFHKLSMNIEYDRLHRLDRLVAVRSRTSRVTRTDLINEALNEYLEAKDPTPMTREQESAEAMDRR